MKYPTKHLLLLVCLLCVVGCTPSADDTYTSMTDSDRNAIEEQLIQMEYDWIGAFTSRDPSALNRIFASDFVYTFSDGRLVDKNEFISLQQGWAAPDSVFLENMETHWYGATALITGIGVEYSTGDDGDVVRYAGQFTNVFMERDGNWQAIIGHISDLD